MCFYVSEVVHLKERDCLFKEETMLGIPIGIKVKVKALNIGCTCSCTGFDFYSHIYLAVPSLCRFIIFHEAAKGKIIAQAAAVASASVANKVLISEWAPSCRETLLEGSYCSSNWNFAYTCLLCVWWGKVGHNAESRFVCLAWLPVRVFGKTARKVLCAVLPACFWCLALCASDVRSCFPSMLSDKKKKAYVWRMEYGLNHTFCVKVKAELWIAE